MRRRLSTIAVAVTSVLTVLGAAVWLTGRHQPPASRAEVISGPYARMLAQAADLGPARDGVVQMTAQLQDKKQPVRLTEWAGAHHLSVRWRGGDDWALIEGAPAAVAEAFGLPVRDYRIRGGPDDGRVFYASPQQPAVPSPARAEVAGMGRILGYTPVRESFPFPSPPRDIPDGGLRPHQLLNAYNATPLAEQGHTGKGHTVVVFGFDGFLQSDMDAFADTVKLPRFTPEVIGGMPDRRGGEANMDLQVIHAIVPDAKLVLVNARSTTTNEGGGPFAKLGQLMESIDAKYPGAVWSFSIGWGCDRLFTAADFAPVRAALQKAMKNGTTAFNASGDLAGLECKGRHNFSEPPTPDDVGVDAVASLPEMTAIGGTKLSTDADGRWLGEQSWYNIPLTLGTAGGVSSLFPRPEWQTVGLGSELPDRRLVPDISAVADPFTGVRLVFDGEVTVGGGTSQAAPIWAGFATLINEELASKGVEHLGDFNPTLYTLSKATKLPPGIRDINYGGNAISISGTSGYDMVTGLGTPNVANMAKAILLMRSAT